MAEKEFESEDPFTLTGMVLPMSKESAREAEASMASCFIEEYILLGYADEEILELFRNPFYQATHAVFESRGEKYIHHLIHIARYGTEQQESSQQEKFHG